MATKPGTRKIAGREDRGYEWNRTHGVYDIERDKWGSIIDRGPDDATFMARQQEYNRKEYEKTQKAEKDADARRTSAAKSTRKRTDNVDHIARHKAEMEEINKRNAERSRANATATAAGFSTRKRTDNVNTVPIKDEKPKAKKMESLKSAAAKGFDSAW